ncbi:hypothetical protein [Natranaeroarchaeum aerophilus]|uniref:Uncharacterized protein n=1 Tax=Natranaeroarchaeum aerophilus TaxID=2917711 RepID=A0AAE3FNC3_9EURY|nr:hypothetical protein [Natranaeroarchaeum aerophilus]MCL9812304.1 hypothetical protein [Natranaeroarchaeum aerophilus]
MAHRAGRYGDLDYPTLTKYGFFLGLGMFLVGVVGELLLAGIVLSDVPGWVHTLFFDMEALGVVVAFLSVVVFGIVLPLTE